MYKAIKSLIKSLLPKGFLLKNEAFFRNTYSLFYSGNTFQCNICETKLRKFVAMENGDRLCPKCGSIQRNRRLYALLKSELLHSGIAVLDFSPSRCLYRSMKKTPEIQYQSTDFAGEFFADKKFDITNIDAADSTYDLVICYHVLEHIEDDIKAMSELHRILKPKGKGIIQTPFKEGEIYEDYSIQDSAGRLKYFGQDDHVRIYSASGLKARLESCGFSVEIRKYIDEENYNGFSPHETILLITK